MADGWPPNVVHVMAMELEHAPGWQGVVAAGMRADLSPGISECGRKTQPRAPGCSRSLLAADFFA
jgi:hypothetical protein